MLQRFFILCVHRKGQAERKGRALPLGTAYLDGTAQFVQQRLDDRHSQARALVLGAGIGFFLRKGAEQFVLYKRLAHTHAGIGDGKLVPDGAILIGKFFGIGVDAAVGAVVLDGIAE